MIDHSQLPTGKLEEAPTVQQVIAQIKKRWPDPSDDGTGYLPVEKCSAMFLAKILSEYTEALLEEVEVLQGKSARWKVDFNHSFARTAAILDSLGGHAILDPEKMDWKLYGDKEIWEHPTEGGNWMVELRQMNGGKAE